MRGYTAMWLLRYLLLAASVIGLGVLIRGYSAIRHPSLTDDLILGGVGIGLAMNFIYVFMCPPFGTRPKSRIARLGGLWLEAKERELRERAGETKISN